MINERLAHYEIVEKIGEGGMGEVYRARDSKLGRDVALKFLPDVLGNDAERLGRFEREARLLAALNHPHIASIHGFEQVDDKRFLVLEMVEGEDLAKRIERGALPIDEAISIARHVADALETAHDEGIIHRDLKPGNIAVTPEGKVKVLDFGLAKAWESDADSQSRNLSHSPTVLSDSPTMAGVILGTAAYMSPEQARGKQVDRRADIFAFGCVLFEMLTGRQIFSGETVSDTLAGVLRADPEWDTLPQDTPRAVVKLLRRCLDKDPRSRLRDIGEARITLERVMRGEDDPDPEAPAEAVVPAARGGRTGWIAAAALAVVAAGVALAFVMKPVPESQVTRLSVLPPDGVRFNLRGIHPGPAVISPDGKRIAFTGRQSGSNSLLFVRELEATDARALPGTEEAGYPFWSPDGLSVAFFTDGKLRRADMTGGPPLTLCDATAGKGGTWSREGVIVMAPSFNTSLHRVSENGGVPEPVTVLNTSRGDNSHRFPQFLPDGEHFLYFCRAGGETSTIRVGALSSDFDKEVMRSTSNAIYSSGHLLFLRESTLMARPFDVSSFEFTGAPVPVGDPVRYIPGAMIGIFTASDNGLLVYQGGGSVPGAHVVWRERDGTTLDTDTEIIQQDNIDVSPDGKLVCTEVFDNVGGTSDLWIYDTDRRIRTRFTFEPVNDLTPVFSPDGSRVAFSSSRDGIASIFTKAVGGASNEEILLEEDANLFAEDWSSDGKYFVYLRMDSSATGDQWVLPMDGSGDPFALLDSRYGEYGARVSPDGNWVAYYSDESGQFEVYVTSFPEPGRKWQISSGGGIDPEWAPDGSAVFYIGSNTFYRVETEPGETTFGIGQTERLFESNTAMSYDIDPSTGNLVLIEDADEGGINPLTVVTGWVTDLERKVR